MVCPCRVIATALYSKLLSPEERSRNFLLIDHVVHTQVLKKLFICGNKILLVINSCDTLFGPQSFAENGRIDIHCFGISYPYKQVSFMNFCLLKLGNGICIPFKGEQIDGAAQNLEAFR